MGLINLSYLNDLADNDQDFIHEILTIFKTHTPAELEKLEAARQTADLQTIKAIAHKLKSSAANLGMSETQALFIRIETAVKSQEPYPQISDMISLVIDQCRQAIREVEEKLNA